MKLVILGALILGVLGPLHCDGDSGEQGDLDRLRAMEAEIDRMIGTPTCRDGTECRYAAFGAKPCGGPWKYKIYSTATVDTTRLLARVAAYNAFNTELNRKYKWISDCSVPPVPIPGCRDGRCADVGVGGKE